MFVAEFERIRKVFTSRKAPADAPLDLFRLCLQQERQEALLLFFREIGLSSLKNLRVLDVGCGSGGQVRRLTDFGAEPENCFGIDLFLPDLAGAREQTVGTPTSVAGFFNPLPYTSVS